MNLRTVKSDMLASREARLYVGFATNLNHKGRNTLNARSFLRCALSVDVREFNSSCHITRAVNRPKLKITLHKNNNNSKRLIVKRSILLEEEVFKEAVE